MAACPDISPDLAALAALCLGRTPDAAAGPVAWAALPALAQRHGVVPALAKAVRENEHVLLPDHARQTLFAMDAQNTQRAFLFTAETVRVVDCLAARGIPARPLKGCILAQQLYGSVAARQVGDIDLLIAPDDWVRADACLRALGFRRTAPARLSTGRQVRQRQRRRKDAIYWHGQSGHCLELHWRLFDSRFLFPVGDPFDEALKIAGRPMPVMRAEMLALYACVHGAWSRWSRLKWLLDAYWLLRAQEARRDEFLAAASRLGLSRIVAQTCALCRSIFGEAPLTGFAADEGEMHTDLARQYPLALLDDPAPGLGGYALPWLMLRRLRYHWALNASLKVKWHCLYLVWVRVTESVGTWPGLMLKTKGKNA